MALAPGARLGPYEITALLGEGGMGKVWRGHHTALRRDDALKVLPDEFATSPERLARFRREAQVLASLNHPNIAHVFGLEQTAGVQALIMELVDGPTLADRIAQGPIPVDEALPIARQIAEALEAAHEQRIIHRDLKPANIKLRPDGAVKVLDFGLAKALDPDSSPIGASHAPTMTSPAMMTGVGMLLGTAAYMAPEQARGKPVDKRADIWAFGCVLFEMLSGHRAFDGSNTADTVASVLRGEPDWTLLPIGLPLSLHTLLSRCLVKDPRLRLRDIGDARLDLDPTVEAQRAGGPYGGLKSLWRRAVPPIAAALIGVGIGGYSVWTLDSGSTSPLARFVLNLPAGEEFTHNGRIGLAISPSGSHIVYTANGRIVVRPLDRIETATVPGTEAPEGAGLNLSLAGRNPFFSPDGRWLGFWQAGELKKVAMSGGMPIVLCAAPLPFGASWSADDSILFGSPKGIMRVPASGGTPELLISTQPGETAQGPQLLPGGRAVLFAIRPTGTTAWNDGQIVIQSLDSGSRTVLVRGGADARYLPTGHLLYASEGAIVAARFDVDAAQVSGNSVPVLEGVEMIAASGAAHLAVSSDGIAVYRTAGATPAASERSLTWVDRDGREEAIDTPRRGYHMARLSPDGRHAAIDIREAPVGFGGAGPGEEDIWILEFAQRSLTRLTFEPGRQGTPVWSRDGQRVIFNGALTGLYWQAADGTGRVDRLTQSSTWQLPLSVSPDGRSLVFREEVPDGNGFPSLEGSDLMVIELAKRETKTLIQTPFIEMDAEISPDGRWLAYVSNESGRLEVYVRPYPNVGDGRWQVSNGGGRMPLWMRSGNELVYVTTTNTDASLMGVRFSAEPAFSALSPTQILDTGGYWLGAAQRTYDASNDGRRFLMIKNADTQRSTAPNSIVVVMNWFDELNRLVPTD